MSQRVKCSVRRLLHPRAARPKEQKVFFKCASLFLVFLMKSLVLRNQQHESGDDDYSDDEESRHTWVSLNLLPGGPRSHQLNHSAKMASSELPSRAFEDGSE